MPKPRSSTGDFGDFGIFFGAIIGEEVVVTVVVFLFGGVVCWLGNGVFRDVGVAILCWKEFRRWFHV